MVNVKAEMTSKERLLAALEGQAVDRFPVNPRCWRCAQWKGLSEVEFARKYDFDLIHFGGYTSVMLTPFRDPFCEKIGHLLKEVKIEIDREEIESVIHARRKFHTPGGVLEDYIVQPMDDETYGVGAVQEWKEPIIKSASDVELLPYLLPDPIHIRDQFPSVHRIEEELGDGGIFSYRPAHGVDEVVVDAIGPENALIWSIAEKDALNRTVELVEHWYYQLMKEVLEGGFKFIFDAWFNFSLSVGWPPSFYIDTVVPLIRRHKELIDSYGGKLLYYDDGKVKDVIGEVIDAGVDFVQTITAPPAGDIDYKWLAEEHGGKTCFNGGVDCVKVRFGSPEEIRQEVRNALDILGPTRKFILGTSDSLVEHTSEENLQAYFQTAREYGSETARRVFG
jgi:uroporphyrinogen-III decarboxylase